MITVNSGSNWPSRGVAMARNTRGSAMLGPGPRRMRGLGKRSPRCALISVLDSFHERARTKVQREMASYHFFSLLDTPGIHGSHLADADLVDFLGWEEWFRDPTLDEDQA